MFRRNKKKADGSTTGSSAEMEGSATSFSSSADPRLQDKAQEVMKDNLELMKDIVMKIREDPEFAKNIYSNCPRLQHLLTQYPDLRPIFENPKLVRINFEQVYRDAGGVLPEDEEKSKKKSWLVWLVNSPIFKVLKLVLFVKKLVGCIAGGGFAFISGCIMGCCFEDALEELEADEDASADMDGGPDPTQEALNKAAEHMEDPEVQEQMQRLLEDPDNLQEAIENDDELRALRDSNPLCEELMSDPDTMRVLTDPENLRALGEAPSLIEADFIDPDSFTPDADVDIETGDGDFDIADGGDDDFDTGGGGNDADANFDDADGDGDAEADGEGEDEGDENEEEEGWWDDAELEEQEVDMDNDADGDDKNANESGNNARSQARAQARQQQQQSGASGGMRGIMASIGVAATDVIAAQIVGNIFGDEILPGVGGGELDMDDGVGDVANEAGDVINDDVADVVEDTHNEVNETANDSKNKLDSEFDMDVDDDGKKTGGAAAGVAGVGAAGAMFPGGTSRGVANGEGDEEAGEGFNDEEETEEEPKKKNKLFGAIKNLGSAVATAAKEHVAGAILGEDFGESLVERMEGGDDDKEEDEEKGDGDKKGKDEDEGKSKTRGFFGRSRR
jgi:hypothetical protein